MPRSRQLVLALLLAAGMAACAEPVPDAMWVGDLGFPEAQVAALQESERQVLADLVGFGLALARDEDEALLAPILRRELEAARVTALPYQLGATELGLGEGELRLAYEAAPEWELEVRHVVRLADARAPTAEREAARQVAEEVARRAAAGEDFASLAARFSEEPGAAQRGGLLQAGRQGSWVDAFWEAAVALQPGGVSGVVETVYGFHVLRLEGRAPVPFEEANRTLLLRRAVPIDVASDAMEAWAGEHAFVLLDPPAVQAARAAMASGHAVQDTLVLATGVRGATYSGADLTVGWARLTPDQRATLEGADEVAFGRWVEGDAREVVWAHHARLMGVAAPPSALPDAEAVWYSRVGRWALTLGFQPEMPDERVRTLALEAVLSGAPEVRSTRLEMRSLRPLLRGLYPVSYADDF